MSGSCQLKTCWKSAPDFRIVGKILKLQYRRAVMVDQTNLGSGAAATLAKTNTRRIGRPDFKDPQPISRNQKLNKPRNRQLEASLFFYQRSPNYCDHNQNLDIPGTEFIIFSFVQIIQMV